MDSISCSQVLPNLLSCPHFALSYGCQRLECVKDNVYQITGHEGSKGERYSCTLSLTSAVDGVGVQRHVAVAFPPGKRPVTHCIEGWVGSQSRSGRVRKIPPPPGFDPLTVQLVVIRCTDCVILVRI